MKYDVTLNAERFTESNISAVTQLFASRGWKLEVYEYPDGERAGQIFGKAVIPGSGFGQPNWNRTVIQPGQWVLSTSQGWLLIDHDIFKAILNDGISVR